MLRGHELLERPGWQDHLLPPAVVLFESLQRRLEVLLVAGRVDSGVVALLQQVSRRNL